MARNQPNENTLSNDKPVSKPRAVINILDLQGRPNAKESSMVYSDIGDQPELVKALAYLMEKDWTKHWAGEESFYPQKALTRKELAYLISEVFDPFGSAYTVAEPH